MDLNLTSEKEFTNLITRREYDILKDIEYYDYLVKSRNGKIYYGRDIEVFDVLDNEWEIKMETVKVSDDHLYKQLEWGDDNTLIIQKLLLTYELIYKFGSSHESIINTRGKKKDRNVNQSQLANMFDSFLSERMDNDVIRDNIQEIGEAVFDFMVDFKEKDLKLDIEGDVNNG